MKMCRCGDDDGRDVRARIEKRTVIRKRCDLLQPARRRLEPRGGDVTERRNVDLLDFLELRQDCASLAAHADHADPQSCALQHGQGLGEVRHEGEACQRAGGLDDEGTTIGGVHRSETGRAGGQTQARRPASTVGTVPTALKLAV
jgi:hypothetical protein